MERVDPDLFYDQSIVGVEGGTLRGHRGVPADSFYQHENPDAVRPHFLVRTAERPWRFASVMFGFGFFAVFVRQAPIHLQIILGAPIFEELVKFGLALLVGLSIAWLLGGARLRNWEHPAWAVLHVPIALAVGAGFGFLEHWTSYSSESLSSYIWRVIFHSASCGATMVAFHAALPSSDVRIRWLALVPSVLFHYLNNYAAITLGLGSAVLAPLGFIAGIMSNVVVILLVASLITMAVVPSLARSMLEALASKLPAETE